MKRFSNILFVAEHGVDNTAAFLHAVTIANNNQAKFTLIGLVDVLNIQKANKLCLDDLVDVLVEQRREQLQSLVHSQSALGVKVEIKVIVGKAYLEIIYEVLQHQRDLLIKSVEGSKSIGQQFFGSTDQKLLRKCPCPVWLIKSTEQQGYREILVGLDYQPENAENENLNKQILEMATALALADSSELHVVHAWNFMYEDFFRSKRTGFSNEEVDEMMLEEETKRRCWLAETVNKYCRTLDVETDSDLKPQLILLKGEAKTEVPKYAKDIGVELIVMGTICRTGIPGLLIGNTAEEILNQVDCSVLTVKPDGFVSPMTPKL